MNFNPQMMQNFIKFMNSGKNPQEFLNTAMQSNPTINALINQIKQSGMTPKEFTQQYFKQNNMDFSQIEKMMNNKGIK